MFTKSLTIQFNQPVTMSVLFSSHLREQFRRGGKICAKRFGKVAIDAGILFLGRDGEGEYLRFVQVSEMHDAKLSQ
jgi:hypothetical protein